MDERSPAYTYIDILKLSIRLQMDERSPNIEEIPPS